MDRSVSHGPCRIPGETKWGVSIGNDFDPDLRARDAGGFLSMLASSPGISAWQVDQATDAVTILFGSVFGQEWAGPNELSQHRLRDDISGKPPRGRLRRFSSLRAGCGTVLRPSGLPGGRTGRRPRRGSSARARWRRGARSPGRRSRSSRGNPFPVPFGEAPTPGTPGMPPRSGCLGHSRRGRPPPRKLPP